MIGYTHIQKYTRLQQKTMMKESYAFSSKVTQASNLVYPLLDGDEV